MKEYLAARIRSFGYAFHGLSTLVSTQPHARIHLVATLLVLAAGLRLHFLRWEWAAILLCIGMVWMAEAMNSAIEFLADEVTLERRERIGKAKDVAAGGVLVTAAVSVIVAMLVLWHHLSLLHSVTECLARMR